MLKDIKPLLRKGIVKFNYSYTNKPGLRYAKGTLDTKLIPKEFLNKLNGSLDSISREEGDYTLYFDLDSNGWRKFLNRNLIEVE